MDEIERYNEIYERMATEEQAQWLPLLNRVKRACKKEHKWSWDMGQFELYTGVCLGQVDWRALGNIFPNDIRVTLVRDLRIFDVTDKVTHRR